MDDLLPGVEEPLGCARCVYTISIDIDSCEKKSLRRVQHILFEALLASEHISLSGTFEQKGLSSSNDYTGTDGAIRYKFPIYSADEIITTYVQVRL